MSNFFIILDIQTKTNNIMKKRTKKVVKEALKASVDSYLNDKKYRNSSSFPKKKEDVWNFIVYDFDLDYYSSNDKELKFCRKIFKKYWKRIKIQRS